MKPGNLLFSAWCQIRRQTKDEDSITHIGSFGVRFLFLERL